MPQDLSAEPPSGLRGHGWGLGADGLRAPNPASPRRRTRGECDSGAGNPQQSSRAQGARGSPAPHRPMESTGTGAKTACAAFLSGGALGLWFAARGEFPFAECSSQKLVLGRRCDGASALSSRAGWGAWLGTGRRRPSHTQSCFPTTENMLGVGLGRQRPPAKQQGPGSQGQPSPASPYPERRAWGENGLCCFPEPRHVGAVVCCPRRVSLCRMQLQEARFGSPLRQDLGAERPSWLRGHGWAQGAEVLHAPNPASPRRRTFWEWVLGAGTPSKAAGPREPGAAQLSCALWRVEGGCGKWIAVLSCLEARWSCGLLPRRVSLCRMQLPEARFGP